MIRITPLASSSSGNAYLIDDGTTKLLLECGIRYKDIKKGVGFRVSEIAGCLLSHEHGDHAKSAREVMKAGVDVYASPGTLGALKLDGHRANPIHARQPFDVGTWRVLPFEVEHDVEEPFGFLLANRAGDKLMFATDTYYIRYKFDGLTHIMVEANYSMEILDENIASGAVPAVMKKRLLRSHFNLENVLNFLKANDLRKVEEVWLLHLSDTNSDEAMFKRRVQELTGKQVHIAKR